MSIVTKRLHGSRCDLVWSLEVGLGPGHTVVDADPSLPHEKRGKAHVCCGQMAQWIKMPLGTMVGLGPGNIVLVADPAPPPRGTAPSQNLSPRLLWPKSWMDQDATWYKGRLRPKLHCVTWGPSSPLARGTAPLPFPQIFGKRSPISATAEHLFFFKPLELGTLSCQYKSQTN